MANKKITKSAKLTGIDPLHKLRLIKKNGEAVYWTINQALKIYNFKQLGEKSQNILKKGTSATKLIQELNAE